MRRDADAGSLLRTLGSAVVGVGLGLAVLFAGFFISRTTLADNTVVVFTSTSSPAQTRSPSPTPRPTTTPARIVAPSVAPTAPPTPTPDPLLVTAYQSLGLRLAALTVPAGYTVRSPIAGTVTVVLYQFINGEVRSGADLQDQPAFPYVLVRSSDREIKLRPGAVDKDVQLVVKDGDTIVVGAPLFKTLTGGPSSWAAFYDKAVTAQVIASVTTRPAGIELDPVPVFKK